MADPQGPQEARIGVFLRLRPVARPTDRITASPEEGWLEFSVPRDAKDGCASPPPPPPPRCVPARVPAPGFRLLPLRSICIALPATAPSHGALPPALAHPHRRLINNSRELYRFPFDGLLQPAADQAEVFDRVAAPVLRAALDGYNGTVFAFGQTGSGKTFTITGGPEHYADRGLIPRAVSALFAEAAARGGYTYTLHVSYMCAAAGAAAAGSVAQLHRAQHGASAGHCCWHVCLLLSTTTHATNRHPHLTGRSTTRRGTTCWSLGARWRRWRTCPGCAAQRRKCRCCRKCRWLDVGAGPVA